MRLIITEKNDAAKQIASLLGGQVKADKVYKTPVYYFKSNIKFNSYNGNIASDNLEDCVTIGLRGHIMEPDFVPRLQCLKTTGWRGITQDGKKVSAQLPKSLDKPPYKAKRKPYLKDGIDLKVWRMEALPYLSYGPIEKLNKEKEIIRAIKNLAKKSDSVVIATDFDREGELIGGDALMCVLDVNPDINVSRARYSAFIKGEIEHAFTHLVDLDKNLADAGATRQDIDLVWGAVLTRFLTLVKFAGYGNVRSAGRVQTPTLALVVEKERERQAFVPEDYWVIEGSFGDSSNSDYKVEDLRLSDSINSTSNNLKEQKPDLPPGAFIAPHKISRFKVDNDAKNVMSHLEGQTSAKVIDIEQKDRKVNPPAPFNTTSLMAAASSIGITPARTMRIAEGLYMAGYISYPRVDNTVYPKSLDLADIVKKLEGNHSYKPYCEKLLHASGGQMSATRGKKETTDHPPIYPTRSANPDDLSAADFKLYNLIARRFLATLSGPATMLNTKISLQVGSSPVDELFVAKGQVLAQAGFREIYKYGLKADEQLPNLKIDEVISFNGARCLHKQTEPSARYSQGRLLQQMEKLGLGTKATRHAIIERLYTVRYIVNDPIEPSQLGIAVINALEKFAPHITHPEMTAQLESEMDNIVEGRDTRASVVLDSRNKLAGELDNLMPHKDEIADDLSDAVAADAYVGKCPKCGKDLQIRASQKTRGMFIGCAGWPDCDVTYPLPSGKIEALKKNCEICGMPMVKVTAFRQRPKELCIDPECPTNKEKDVVVGICQTCKEKGIEANLIAHKNPKTLKRFIRCENYEVCNTGYPLPQYGSIEATNEICDDCGAPIVIVNTQRGPWRICPNFKCPAKEKQKTKMSSSKKKSKN